MTFLCPNFPSNFCFHQAGASRRKIVIIESIMEHPPFMLTSHSFFGRALSPSRTVTMASSDFRRHGQISPPTPPPILHRSTPPPPPSHQRPLPYHPTPTFGWLLHFILLSSTTSAASLSGAARPHPTQARPHPTQQIQPLRLRRHSPNTLTYRRGILNGKLNG